MSDRILKAVIMGGKARIAVLDTTGMVNRSVMIHNLSPLAAAALGRALTAGAYIASNLKNNAKFSLIVDGGGPLGKIVIAGESGGTVRGFVENPSTDLPAKNGKLDVGSAVGKDGFITVIKDFGLKEPYVGKCKLVSGEIAEDFTSYLLTSEGIPSAVALGVLADAGGCKASGGIIAEALPDADDGDILILEDIMSNFKHISALLAQKPVEEIMDFYFGHLDAQLFPAEELKLECRCNEKIHDVIRSLGRKEAYKLIKERDFIEARCDFCNKTYTFSEFDLKAVFTENNG